MHLSMTMEGALRRLRSELNCEVVLPGDPAYEQERKVWNARVDRYPAAIVKCRSGKQIAQAVDLAAQLGLAVTARGGGHNVAGNAVFDDAMVIDTRHIKNVHFNQSTRTVTVGAGSTWSAVDRMCARFGAAVPSGIVSHTGVSGLALGGGTGYLSRLHGTTSDNLLSADVVLVGRRLKVEATDHSELFWALRGAGHNLGITVSFTFQTHRLSHRPFVRQSIVRGDKCVDLAQTYREWAPTQPDALTTYLHLLHIPPWWTWLPSSCRGGLAMNLLSVFYGDEQRGMSLTDPIHREAAWTRSCVMSHVDLQRGCDADWRAGLYHYWRPALLKDVPDDALRSIVDWCERHPPEYEHPRQEFALQPLNQFELHYRGGQLSRIDEASSAYSDRSSAYNCNVQAIWSDPKDEAELVAWADGFASALAPYRVGAYKNFSSTTGDQRENERIFGADKYARLCSVKASFDPGKVFIGLDGPGSL
jgi:FAD/FMN-containing dehydrogenase